ncbi:MAG: endolytic transglycosylase MltG [Bacteroidales bacterium]|nr:endolytic transglycosylase MltG [Bacteroidales bacterium]
MLLSKKTIRVSILILLLIIAVMVITGYRYFQMVYGKNVDFTKGDEVNVYVYTGEVYLTTYKKLCPYLIDSTSFKWVASKKKANNKFKPGKYKLRRGMSNNELVNMLRGGLQSPVKLVFNNIRTLEELASKVSLQIEADSIEIINLLNDETFLKEYGLSKETVMCVFIPNTYELYWNTSAEGFFKKMFQEYEKFWTKDRLNKTESIGLDKFQVITLASIVDEETTKKDEMPVIAGVYMNRLKKGMRLQADPTVIFAVGDFTIRRVLDKHKEFDSPYNTYKYSGLPPGPISMPSITALDAVLNYKEHNYLYFCAKEDFSGYHNFAKTYEQHLKNAERYKKALNKLKIYR